ncbi:MAG: ROK family protein [Dehalococcoidia bacterium]|nr:ROK family protein [Dehalococcoidia bacterium]
MKKIHQTEPIEKRGDELLTVGVDVGGTKIDASVVDSTGNILTSHRCPTNPEKGPDGVITNVIECVKNCLGEIGKSAQALGIGMAGQVEKDTGVVRFAPNLDWHDIPLRAKLEEALQLPVTVTNDVRAATYGEWSYGAGQNVDDLLCLFVGTGIGGGIVSGGKLLEGCRNSAGELGHITIVTNGRKCHCRNRGCLEAYAGGWAIGERAQETAHSDLKSGQPLITSAGSIDQITAATVSEAYKSGDPMAKQIVEETALYLAAGLVAMANAFNPCLIVMGGGVIQGLPEYIPMAEHIVRLNALETALEGLRIVKPALGDKAGVIGAAALARQYFQESKIVPGVAVNTERATGEKREN